MAYINDSTPMGINNLNMLVDSTLGVQSYQVVRSVYDNLNWLNSIFRDLASLNRLNNYLHQLDALIRHLPELEELCKNLKVISDVNLELPTIKELAPKIQGITEDIKAFNSLVNSNQSDLNKLKEEYKSKIDELQGFVAKTNQSIIDVQVKLETSVRDCKMYIAKKSDDLATKYDELAPYIPMMKYFASNYEVLQKQLIHLTASDRVNNYLAKDPDTHSYELAVNAILESETAGNCEKANRIALGLAPKSKAFSAITKGE